MTEDNQECFVNGRPLSLAHPDAPKADRVLPTACRDAFLYEFRNWVIQEQMRRIRRYGDDEALYNHNIGYMLCLSNMIEFLLDMESAIVCSRLPKEDQSDGLGACAVP